jgi:type III restriction enzyme
VYAVNWFDSKPERDLAVLLDESDKVTEWCRLVNEDLTIVWAVSGQRYNADFVVVTTDGTRWIVEVKGDNTITSEAVQQKREAAKRWVNKVNASGITTDTWRYLLVTESDILSAKGSWGALERLGR